MSTKGLESKTLDLQEFQKAVAVIAQKRGQSLEQIEHLFLDLLSKILKNSKGKPGSKRADKIDGSHG